VKNALEGGEREGRRLDESGKTSWFHGQRQVTISKYEIEKNFSSRFLIREVEKELSTFREDQKKGEGTGNF